MKTKKVLLSICCITYNQEKFIQDALDGFESQKVNFPIEIIIYDDFSQDSTREKLIQFKKKSKYPVQLILSPENRYSKGDRIFPKTIIEANGKYVALCEGDDYWTDPLKLQRQVDFMEKNTEYSMCFHEAEIVNAKSEVLKLFNNIKTTTSFSLYSFTQKNNVSTASCMFRNNITISVDKFQKLKVGDWALHILNAEVGKIHYMPEIMSAYRIHNEGIWSSLSHNNMVLRGIEVMKQLDVFFDYKYHDDFQEGIDKRLLKLKNKKKPPTIVERIKRKIKNLIN